MRRSSSLALCATLALALGIAACSGERATPTTPSPATGGGPPTETPPPQPPNNGPTPPPASPPPSPPSPGPSGRTGHIIAVGDIGMCGSGAVALTANLAEGFQGDLVLAGDLAYMQGSMNDFVRCFDPAWGRLRGRIRPVPGNHEYETPNAAGYFQYFGSQASPIGRSFYSFRSGDWLVLALDSNIAIHAGSEQYEYVRSQLQGHNYPCAMAVWHHPLFSSGPNGPNPRMRDIWGLLYQMGADVVVAGHDHLYERFGKQDVDGRSDPRGLRQFIAGTGGANLYPFLRSEPNQQWRESAHGVLRLTLNYNTYQWAFVDTARSIRDSGTDGCH